MAAFGVFGLCQIHAFVDYLRSKLNAQQFEVLFKSVISLVGFILLSVGTVLMLTGKKPQCQPQSAQNIDTQLFFKYIMWLFHERQIRIVWCGWMYATVLH